MYQRISAALVLAALAMAGVAAPALAGNTNNILVTGYWPPTNEAVRQFSRNPAQNPSGWVGRNWEGRGYDVFGFHPEFPNGTGGLNARGVGDFEVDYHDTSLDWDRIIAEVRPVAIITLSRGNTSIGWEMEPRYKRFSINNVERNASGAAIYISDYLAPARPTVGLRMVDEQVAGTIVDASLPMQAIVDAVRASPLVLDPFIPDGHASTFDFGGAFLSGYIGYHGAWHAMENSSPDAPFRCFAGGHIHVGTSVSSVTAEGAAEISVRELIDYLDTVVPSLCPSDVNDDTVNDLYDLLTYLDFWFAADAMAEFTGDDAIDVFDLLAYLDAWFEGSAEAQLTEGAAIDVFDLLLFLDCWFDGDACL